MVERHLISRHFADSTVARTVGVDAEESLSVMVNEEDHLRIQTIMPGFRLPDAFERARAFDQALESAVDFAFSSRWGYLTACPTNVGCGVRVGVMLHLPGLRYTGEMERVKRAAKDMHLAMRGFYGEGSEAVGNFYQVSNQLTLGFSEDLERLVRQGILDAVAKGELVADTPVDDVTLQLVAIANSADPITQDDGSFARLEQLYLAFARIIAHAYGHKHTA